MSHDVGSVAESFCEAIQFLETQVTDPRVALPEELFLFVSRLTPLVNVDLFIRNAKNHVLLTWRDDPVFGQGWHVPGGVVRLGESFADRITAVSIAELGVGVTFEPKPLGIFETVDPTRESRTHHVSLLFDCHLADEPDPQRMFRTGFTKPGAWAWHQTCPHNLLQAPYRDLI